MSDGLLSTQNFIFKLEKVNSFNFVKNSNYIIRKNSILFSLPGTNIKAEKAGELPGVYYFWELSQEKHFFGE